MWGELRLRYLCRGIPESAFVLGDHFMCFQDHSEQPFFFVVVVLK